jgi:peptide chain release factor 1
VRPLLKEAGGHRWQRIPPTERKGRVHTSTVTVAVFPIEDHAPLRLLERDIETFTTRDSGPGGQHRNTTDSCVVMRHKPTGIEAKSATKSQHRNRVMARQMLEARVAAFHAEQTRTAQTDSRRAMVGSGMRGDKIKTYRVRDDQVTDHRSGRKLRLQDVLGGRL